MSEKLNPQVWRGLYARRPAWILGAGPSLLHADPEPMAGGLVIAVTDTIEAPAMLGFPPAEYWLFMDDGFTKGFDVRKRPEPIKLWCNTFPACHLLSQGLTPGGTGRGMTFLEPQVGTCREMSARDTQLNSVGSSVGMALNLAVIMGCSPISLVGVDYCSDSAGLARWSDQPGTVDPDAPCYGHSREFLHAAISHLRESGVEVTVESAKWLLEPHVPFWLRKPGKAG